MHRTVHALLVNLRIVFPFDTASVVGNHVIPPSRVSAGGRICPKKSIAFCRFLDNRCRSFNRRVLSIVNDLATLSTLLRHYQRSAYSANLIDRIERRPVSATSSSQFFNTSSSLPCQAICRSYFFGCFFLLQGSFLRRR